MLVFRWPKHTLRLRTSPQSRTLSVPLLHPYFTPLPPNNLSIANFYLHCLNCNFWAVGSPHYLTQRRWCLWGAFGVEFRSCILQWEATWEQALGIKSKVYILLTERWPEASRKAHFLYQSDVSHNASYIPAVLLGVVQLIIRRMSVLCSSTYNKPVKSSTTSYQSCRCRWCDTWSKGWHLGIGT